MVEYGIWARIEVARGGRYIARVSAIPRGVCLRSAPQERARECASCEEAMAAVIDLGKALGRDIRAGCCVVARPARREAAFPDAPAPANERRRGPTGPDAA